MNYNDIRSIFSSCQPYQCDLSCSLVFQAILPLFGYMKSLRPCPICLTVPLPCYFLIRLFIPFIFHHLFPPLSPLMTAFLSIIYINYQNVLRLQSAKSISSNVSCLPPSEPTDPPLRFVRSWSLHIWTAVIPDTPKILSCFLVSSSDAYLDIVYYLSYLLSNFLHNHERLL